MAIPHDIWERLKLYLAEEGSGRVTLTVVRGRIVSLTIDDGPAALSGDPRFRNLVRSAAVEVLDWPKVVDRIVERLVAARPTGPCAPESSGKSLTPAQRP